MGTWTKRRSAVKSNARKAMRENLGPFLQIAIIVMACSVFFVYLNNKFSPEIVIDEQTTYEMIFEQLKSFMPMGALVIIFINVLNLVIVSPIQLAASEFFMRATVLEETPTLRGLGRWGTAAFAIKAIGLRLWVIILSWFLMIIFFLLPLFISGFAFFYTGSSILSGFIMAAAVIGGIYAAMKSVIYNASFFLFATNPEMGIFNAVKEIVFLMRGHSLEFFVFNLSFILWGILTALTMGLAGLYVYPYMQASTTYFIRDMLREKAMLIAETGGVYE